MASRGIHGDVEVDIIHVPDGHEAQEPGEGLAAARDARLAGGSAQPVNCGRVYDEVQVARQDLGNRHILAGDGDEDGTDLLEDVLEVSGVGGLEVVVRPRLRCHGSQDGSGQGAGAWVGIPNEVEPDGEDDRAGVLGCLRLGDSVVGADGGAGGPGIAPIASVAAVGYAIGQQHYNRDGSRVVTDRLQLLLRIVHRITDVGVAAGRQAVDGALHAIEAGYARG